MNAVDPLASLTLENLDAVVSVIRGKNSAGFIVNRHVVEAALNIRNGNDSHQNERREFVVGGVVLCRDANCGK